LVAKVVLVTGCALISAVARVPAQPDASDILSDKVLLQYASQSYDRSKLVGQHVVLGQNHGVSVIADFPCSDLCPNYTVRIIHYDIPLSKCSEVGGVEKSILVPFSIAAMRKSFCFPKVLTDNWDRYVR